MNKGKDLSQGAINKLMLYKEIVDRELSVFFKEQLREAQKIDKTSYRVIKALEEFNLRGGKRLRASLTFYSFKCFSEKKPDAKIIRASIAIELIQSFLLIHDDIIDRDSLRRGGPTMHKIFEKIGEKDFYFRKNLKEKKHFGMAMAILVGDICSALANILLSEIEIKNKSEILYEINKVVRDTNFGQVIDLRNGYSDKLTKNTALKIYKLKTANYSIETPIKIGAILAGASRKELNKIKEYSELLGIAYNIQDDLLELFGENKKFGKPMGSDLKEGKKTLIILKTLEKATEKEAIFIKEKLGNVKMTNKDIEKIKKIMIQTGSLDYCIKYAKKLIKKANEIVAEQNYKKEGREFILGIGDYLLEREY
jgi:geranylgeranyl diphosphate synthase type I